ncbi:MAG: ORC1-type DNA replication protein [Nanoarchaeota archaeon]|nr:ORC1-type DNA replication protein [Nanoarchaeota archaeon]
MAEKELSNFFNDYLKKEPLFLNRKVFQGGYLPETVDHRDEQIQFIAKILAPILRGDKPSNLFVYGKTGTGKTMCIKYIMEKMMETTNKSSNPLKILYLNCKLKRVADTEYRLIAQLARGFGKEIPFTGLPTDEVYRIFFNSVEKEKKPVMLVLDEIDQLVKKTGDGVLYNLTRCNEELKGSQVSLVGLSNDMVFIDNLDPRVKSSLSEEELVFPPYNALQLQDILRQRAKKAFKDGTLKPGTIEKCAAYSAREHGDARRAIELLRVAGELAERAGENKILLKYIDAAEEKIERDRLVDITASQPKQSQCILYSIIMLSTKKKGNIFTGEIYDFYKPLCQKTGLRPLTQRRISDVIAELDMLGVIHAKVISKGRYGRTREISLTLPDSSVLNIKKILEEGLDLT